MTHAHELAALFRRDLARLFQQLQAFPTEAALWVHNGVANSAGNLMLHVEGNLREYIQHQLGGIPYRRERVHEFAAKDVPMPEMLLRIEDLQHSIPAIIAALSEEGLQVSYPENVFGTPISTRMFLLHLHGHLNYHLGQIDYLRRIQCGGRAIDYVGL